MTLTIGKEVYEAMRSAAREAIPLEACGLLAGRDGHASRFYRLTNADGSPVHFSMIPEEQFAAVKDMRREGLKMLAIWHSHPSTPPRMSEEDLRLAFTPEVLYVISSLADVEKAICGYLVKEGKPEEVKVDIAGE